MGCCAQSKIVCCYQRKTALHEVDEKSVLEYVTLLWSLMLMVLHAIFFPYGVITHLGLFFMILTCFAGIAALQSPKRTKVYRLVTSVFAVLTAIIFTCALFIAVIIAFGRPFAWPVLMPMLISLLEIVAATLMTIKHLTKYSQIQQIIKQGTGTKEVIVMKNFDSQTDRITTSQPIAPQASTEQPIAEQQIIAEPPDVPSTSTNSK